MISKSKIKLIRSLKLKKFRIKNELAVVEGSKIIRELMTHLPSRIESIWALQKVRLPQINEWLLRDQCSFISQNEMKLITSMDSLPDAIALVKIPQHVVAKPTQSLILFLDDVQDPGNVGTIIRTAEWFGHSTIVFSPRCADRFSAKVIQASMGSVFRINIQVMECDKLKQHFPEHQLVYADMNGDNVKEWSNSTTLALVVIGNEGQGVNHMIKNMADASITINGSDNSLTESLNASMAAGMIMHTWGTV